MNEMYPDKSVYIKSYIAHYGNILNEERFKIQIDEQMITTNELAANPFREQVKQVGKNEERDWEMDRNAAQALITKSPFHLSAQRIEVKACLLANEQMDDEKQQESSTQTNT